ncbi:UNVERIFIED_CONTAM: N-acetylated-alpha-linked acidic dipeptidase [Brevibacillus sp. OAP136]
MASAVKQLEKVLLDEISLEAPEAILERFRHLIRESGSEDERIASQFLVSLLEKWGVPYRVHHPQLYLSIPKKARIKLIEPHLKEFVAKTPSFSVSTEDSWGSGELVYIPAGDDEIGLEDWFDAEMYRRLNNLEGKVVITEGYAMPGKVAAFNDKGVAAAIFINPGQNIHDGICTSIWGAPDLDNMNNEPQIPVLAVNKYDGEELKKLSQTGKVVLEFQTQLEKGWFPCPLIDILIKGTEEPEKYVLLHGHLDSWHVGIGDNATGDAALIEMARIFHKHQDKLKRSLRIAIWPGHSTGRYAGSTWFADQFGLDLEENCIAQVNCDSPGCRWATSYEYMDWMSEVDEFCQEAIKDAVGQASKGNRPVRAGDYSFNNIGITSFFMLSSSIPEEILKEKGYYPVGGCGANIEWHTHEDLMHVVDYDVLVKDLQVYITSVIRVLQAPIHPFFFTKTVDDIKQTIQAYQVRIGEHFSFDQAVAEADNLQQALAAFYQRLEKLSDREVTDPQVQLANKQLLQLARILVPINYTRQGKFRHDPALDVPPLPDLAPACELGNTAVGSHVYNVMQTHLTRGQNRVAWALKQATSIVREE